MSITEDEPTTNGFDYDSETASLTEEDKKELEEAVKNNIRNVIAKRNQSLEIPTTVSVLSCPNDTTVYLIGTAHFSHESIEDVLKVMSQVQPDFVVLELCHNRTSVLVLDEEKIKEDIKKLSFFNFFKNHGASNGLLQYVLLRLNAYLIDILGMAPGGEFRAAAREAAKQSHCHVVLGDRPIDVTLQRAFGALGPWTKLKLLVTLLSEFKPITKEEVEAMKNSDFLEEVLKQMAGDQPELKRILLDERDMYLAKSIWSTTGMSQFRPPSKPAADGNDVTDKLSGDAVLDRIRFPFGDRESISTAVGEPNAAACLDSESHQIPSCCPYWPSPSIVPRVVVAVVGIGHVAGIKKYWGHAESIDQNTLLAVMEPPLSAKFFKWTLRGLLLASLAGLSYNIIRGCYHLGTLMYKQLR